MKEKEKQQKKEELSKIAISEDFDLQSDIPVSKSLLKKTFSNEQIEEIKLQALTSVDTKERLKSLRTSMYIPIPNKDKIFILTKALSEDDTKIKLESIGFLKYFGIRPQIAEIFKELVSPKISQKKLALDTLLSMVNKLESIEMTVLIIILLSFLKFENDEKLINTGFQLAEKLSPKIISNLEWTLALNRIIIGKLSESFSTFSENSYKLLKTLLYKLDAKIQEIIFDEIDTIPSKNIKGLFLEAFCNTTTLSKKIISKLPQKIFTELLYWDEMQFECRKLGNCFAKFGIYCLNSIIKNFDSIPQIQKQFFIRLINPVCKSLSISEKISNFLETKFIHFLKKLLLNSNKQEFLTILEENIILNVPVSDKFKIKLSIIALKRAGEFMSDRITDLVLILFTKLNINAIDALYKVYTENFDNAIKKVVLKILVNTRSKYDYEKNKKTLDKFLKTLEGDYAFYIEIKEDILKASAALHGVTNMSERKIEQFSSFLKAELPKSSMPWAIVESFTYLVTSESTPLNIILDIANLLINIIHTPIPEIKIDELKTKDTTIYKIYGSVSIFTDLIPATVICLGKIALHPKISNATRAGILRNLLEKYETLSSFKEVWGPASVSTLINTIKNIATSQYCSLNTQLNILKVFTKSPLTVSICETVSEILNGIELTEATDYYFEFYITKILKEVQLLKNTGDFESMYYIFKCLIKLLNKEELSINKKKNEFLREKIISALIRYNNENIAGMYSLLSEVSKMKNIPSPLAKVVMSKIKS